MKGASKNTALHGLGGRENSPLHYSERLGGRFRASTNYAKETYILVELTTIRQSIEECYSDLFAAKALSKGCRKGGNAGRWSSCHCEQHKRCRKRGGLCLRQSNSLLPLDQAAAFV